jgi:hypothetical protein
LLPRQPLAGSQPDIAIKKSRRRFPGYDPLIEFNDSRTSFAGIRDLILKARASLLPKPKPCHPTTPPELSAWAERTLRNCREKALRQQADAAKVMILAQIQRERAQRAAAGDFRPFWIIGPGVKRDMARKQAELEASARADRRLENSSHSIECVDDHPRLRLNSASLFVP